MKTGDILIWGGIALVIGFLAWKYITRNEVSLEGDMISTPPVFAPEYAEEAAP